MPEFETSRPLPIPVNSAEAAADKHTAGFLRELVRLAEESMKDLEELNNAYERKATLLASLSIAVPGYLLSEISGFTVSWWGWIIYPSFGMAAVFSAKAIDFASYATRGLHPNVVRGFFEPGREPSGKEEKWTLYYMLETYRKGADKNITNTYKKYKHLIRAKFCLISGAGGFLGMSLESVGISARACRCAADFFACFT